MSATHDEGDRGSAAPSEEELRAAYEAEIKRIRIEQVLLEHVVTLVNLGMRKTGIAPGTEDERDPAQVRMAIEAIRAATPVIEQAAPEQVPPIREALSQLQMAFVRIGGAPGSGGTEPAGDVPADGPAAAPEGGPAAPGQPGPAQQSGRLWIPRQ